MPSMERSHHRRGHVARSAMLVVAAVTGALTQGCESPTEPQPPVEALGLVVVSPEGDAGRHLLTVGETGGAEVHAYGTETCYEIGRGDGPWCQASLKGTLTSSDPNVLLPGQTSFDGSADIPLAARAPGSVMLTVTVQNRAAGARVDVVQTPLPVDSVRVRWWPLPDTSALGPESVLATVNDAAGNLDTLTLAAGGKARLRIVAYRQGDPTVYLPFRLEYSDSTMVGDLNMTRIDPWDPEAPPILEELLYGYGQGTATVKVTARGQEFGFVLVVR